MGIKGWFKVFGGSANVIKERDFKNKRLGVDVSYDIYRASLGMKNIKGLTDKNGIPTVMLNILICNVTKYKKLGIRGLIYVFDNPKPNPLKIQEMKKRKEKLNKAKDRLKNVKDKDVSDRLEKRTFKITESMICDVKKLLTLIGVAWVVAPEGFEAEHLGAELTINGTIDSFITSDSDTLLFGGKSMIRRVKKKGTKKNMYEEYNLKSIMIHHKINREQMVRIGVILGSDFSEKTKGIGPGTVIKKSPLIKLTSDQKKAKDYFLSKCPYSEDMVNRKHINKDALIEWLVNDKNFNKARVVKLLSVF